MGLGVGGWGGGEEGGGWQMDESVWTEKMVGHSFVVLFVGWLIVGFIVCLVVFWI